jgi:hypothetical protein
VNEMRVRRMVVVRVKGKMSKLSSAIHLMIAVKLFFLKGQKPG